MRRRALLFFLLALGAGSCGRSRSPEAVDREIRQQFMAGRFPLAVELLNREGARWMEGERGEWRSRFRLLRAEILLLQGETEAAAADLRDNGASAPLEARRQLLLGGIAIRKRQYEEAQRALQAASRGDAETRILALVYTSSLQFRQRDLDGAGATLQRAAEEARAERQDGALGMVLSNLAFLRLHQQQYDDAIEAGREAWAATERSGAHYQRARLASNVAECYTNLGDFPHAREWQDLAFQNARLSADKVALSGLYGSRGNLMYYQDRLQEAAEAYRQAFELTSELKDPSPTWAGNLANIYIRLADWKKAEHWNEVAHGLKRQATNASDERLWQINQGAILAGEGHLDEAEKTFRAVLGAQPRIDSIDWEASENMADVENRRGHAEKSLEHHRQALHSAEHHLEQLQSSELQMTVFSRLIRLYRNTVEDLMRGGRTREALQVAESSRARTLALRAGGRKVASAAQAVALAEDFTRRTGTTVLFYWVAPGRSYVWKVSGGSVTARQLPGSGELEKLARSAQTALEKQLKAEPPAKGSAADRLYAEAFQPELEGLKPGSRVVLIADGALHYVNPECLPVERDGRHYLVEDLTLSRAPSLTQLTEAAPAPRRAGGPMLLVGAPAQATGEFPALPHAAGELQAIGGLFPKAEVVKLERQEATPAAFLAAHPERFQMLHFAAHADAGRLSPLDSAIILAPSAGRYRLYMRQITELPRLSAELVTVSSCRSAGVTSYAGEGLVGFAWAFLEAGARGVVAGLWDLNDASSTALMQGFYARLAAGEDAAAALRAAKLEMLHGGGRLSPYHWGALQLYQRAAAGKISAK